MTCRIGAKFATLDLGLSSNVQTPGIDLMRRLDYQAVHHVLATLQLALRRWNEENQPMISAYVSHISPKL